MPHEAFLFELFNEGRVHVEVHGGVVSWEVNVILSKDLSLDRDGVE